MATRLEADLLGLVEVPAEALYGAQTQRALHNFPTGRQRTLGSFPSLVRSLLLIKKAAAQTNLAIGALTPAYAQAVCAAVDALLPDPDPAHFPIHALHGGGGTSANMCVNEVIANLAEVLGGGRPGAYRRLHPNDHVNLNQSTNDVYPTACHMAVIAQWAALAPALPALALALRAAGSSEQSQPHLARTCLQDAVDIRWGDYFGGVAHQVARLTARLEEAVARLYAVNLGGTICGRAEDVPAAYREKIVPALAEVAGDSRYRQAADLFDAAQNPDQMLAVSAALEALARSLIKIAKDLRLLSSGPEGGLGEVRLPAVQPGSSIMPGKVNPVLPEFLIQVCFRVVGNHTMCAAGLDHGELDLNIWESSMVYAILEAMELLADALPVFTEKCVRGLTLESTVSAAHAAALMPRLTRLAEQYGYQRVTAVCKEAAGNVDALKALLSQYFPPP